MPSTYAISPPFEAFVEAMIEMGPFESADEVVLAGLRLLEDQHPDWRGRHADFWRKIDKGLEDARAGRTIPLEEAFDELHRRMELRRRANAAAE